MDLSDSDSADPLRQNSQINESLSNGQPQGEPLQSESSQAALPVICRAKQTWWWMVLLGTLEVAFMFSVPFFKDDKHPDQNLWSLALITWPFALVMGAAVLSLALDLKRGEIRADNDGLTWRRHFTGWKSARWDEVSDYYQKQTGSNNSRLVETPAGKCELSSTFEGIDRIIDMVVYKASHVNHRGWELKGVRPSENWSRTFSPWSGEQKWTAPLVTCVIVSIPLMLLTLSITSPSQSRPSIGFWMDVFPLILVFVLFVVPMTGGFLWMLITLWRDRKLAWNHRDEKLVLNAQGLVFTSHALNLHAKWDELEAITFLPEEKGIKPIQIETFNGHFVIWKTTNGVMWSQIRLILEQYRPQLFEPHYKEARQLAKSENDLEGERGAWSSGTVGVGARRWGFRSRGTRFSFQCASFVLLFLPIFYPISKYSAPLVENDMAPVISWPLLGALYALSGLIVLAIWLWFHYAAVLADKEGLEVRSPFHPIYRASWQNIESKGQDAWGEFVRVGRRKLYFMRFFPPVRVEELRAHIEQNIMEARAAHFDN